MFQVKEMVPIQPSKEPKDIGFVLAHPQLFRYEEKLDGFRCVAYKRGQQVWLTTKERKFHQRFSDVQKSIAALGSVDFVLDGEIVTLDVEGNVNFNLMFSPGVTHYYYVFDILELEGMSFTTLPFIVRKRFLSKLMRSVMGTSHPTIRLVKHAKGDQGISLLKRVVEGDLEGVVAKRKDAPYDANFSPNWVKFLKTDYSQKIGRGSRFKNKR